MPRTMIHCSLPFSSTFLTRAMLSGRGGRPVRRSAPSIGPRVNYVRLARSVHSLTAALGTHVHEPDSWQPTTATLIEQAEAWPLSTPPLASQHRDSPALPERPSGTATRRRVVVMSFPHPKAMNRCWPTRPNPTRTGPRNRITPAHSRRRAH